MRGLRFSSVILSLVFTLLVVASVILLTPAFRGSEKALEHEIIDSYKRDQRALTSLIQEKFNSIQQTGSDFTTNSLIRLGLKHNQPTALDAAADNLLTGERGRYIDAVVVEDNAGQMRLFPNLSLLGMQLPLDEIASRHNALNEWSSEHLEQGGKFYSLLRLSVAIIDDDMGEVLGILHVFVLLNDNYWIINQLQKLFAANAMTLSYEGRLLDSLLPDPQIEPKLQLAEEISEGVHRSDDSILRDHKFQVGRSDLYSIRSLLPNSSFTALRNAYRSNLSYAAMLVLVLGVITMTVILRWIRKSLQGLTRFAEQASESASPIAFEIGRFREFNRVGLAIERMLLRMRDRDKDFSCIIDNSPNLIFIKDLQHLYKLVNRRFAELFNLQPEQLYSDVKENLLPDKVNELAVASDHQLMDEMKPQQFEIEVETDAGLSTFLVSKFPIIDDKGKLNSIGGIATDVTDMKGVEDRLRLSQQIFAETAEAITVLDKQHQILMSNRAFVEMSGCGENQLSHVVQDFLASYPNLLTKLDYTRRWQGECSLRRANGTVLPVQVSVTRLMGCNGQLRYVLLFRDITDIKIAEQRLEKMAMFDGLTGLPNRSLFYQHLDRALNAQSMMTAVLFIDLDRFKGINDTYGHDTGDELLYQVADRLRTCVHISDTVARLGGDEFTVILTKIRDREQIEAIANRILEALSEPFELSRVRCFSSVSIGVTVCPLDGEDAGTLMKNADTAMYRAKELGRNNYQFFNSKMNEDALERMIIEDGLREALSLQQFEVFYQPQVDVNTQKILGMEALIRWRHPVKGMIPPDKFIPIAEESDLILAIGDWVLLEACKQAKLFHEMGFRDLKVAVNLSARQFEMQEDLLRSVQIVLDQTGLNPNNLELEITETVFMLHKNAGIETCKSLKAMGISLSLDDFGTGYSSLSYLSQFPIHTLKVDRSFVSKVTTDKESAMIVSAIVNLAHNLGLTVVAEGVETDEQRLYLADEACEIYQGYFYSAPMPKDKLIDLLLRDSAFPPERQLDACREADRKNEALSGVENNVAQENVV